MMMATCLVRPATALIVTILLLQIALSLSDVGPPVEIQSYFAPNQYITTENFDHLLDERRLLVRLVDWEKPETQWQLESPGLCGEDGTVSIRQYTPRSGLAYAYMSGSNSMARVVEYDDFEDYKKVVCLKIHKDLWFPGTVAFESLKWPGNYMRNDYANYLTELADYSDNLQFKQTASYRLLEVSCNYVEKKASHPTWPEDAIALDGKGGFKIGKMTADAELFMIQHPGLSGQANSVSFQLCKDAITYMTASKDLNLQATSFISWGNDPVPEPTQFNLETTFIEHTNLYFSGYSSYESVLMPGYYLMRSTSPVPGKLVLSNLRTYDEKVDASFKIVSD